jgi:predicted Zn-dependent protease
MAFAAAREAQFGNTEQAKVMADRAMKLSAGLDAKIAVAMTLAQISDTASAQRIVDQLNSEFPLDSIIQNYWLPTIRATIALSHGNAQEAVKLLEVTIPFQLSLQNFSSMLPIFVRGQAFLKAGQGNDAAAQFELMLSRRGVGANAPVEALAHLELGRAYAMSGYTGKSKVAYQDFLTLWKDADPDLPILKEAKGECAKLQ